MKKFYLLFVAVALLMSCMKQNPINEISDQSGNQQRIKFDMTEPLLAGQYIEVGYMHYQQIGEVWDTLEVTYEITDYNWEITETHLFAGTYPPPMNKPGAPQIGQFPFSIENLAPGTHQVTYTISENDLSLTDFTLAAHCIVHNVSTGKNETAWGHGESMFDKGWGMYVRVNWDEPTAPVDPNTVLFGTKYAQDTLKVYRIDVTANSITLNLSEYFPSTDGEIDGAAFDVSSGTFFFTQSNNLFVNRLNDTVPSYNVGSLDGVAASGTFYYTNDVPTYYYVDGTTNIIHAASLDGDMTYISNESLLDTVPTQVTVNDIAMNPTGDTLYILGDNNTLMETQLIKYSFSDNTFYTLGNSIDVNPTSQIAFGGDGSLYVISPNIEGGTYGSFFATIGVDGTLTIIENQTQEDDDPIFNPRSFTDLSTGPLM